MSAAGIWRMAKSISIGAAAAASGVATFAAAAPSHASADTAAAKRTASRRETGRGPGKGLVRDVSHTG